jgi:hypothetical protein
MSELQEQRVAVTVFVTVRAIDERDAGAIATYAIRDTLGDQQILTVKDDARVVHIVDVMDTGTAAGNGYLWLRPTAKSYRERGGS